MVDHGHLISSHQTPCTVSPPMAMYLSDTHSVQLPKKFPTDPEGEEVGRRRGGGGGDKMNDLMQNYSIKWWFFVCLA